MVGNLAMNVMVLFSIITGTAACLLSVLAWEILKRSPFGRAVFVLSGALVLFVLYHVLLLLLPPNLELNYAFKSVLYTVIAAFVWMMVWSQSRLRERASGEVAD